MLREMFEGIYVATPIHWAGAAQGCRRGVAAHCFVHNRPRPQCCLQSHFLSRMLWPLDTTQVILPYDGLLMTRACVPLRCFRLKSMPRDVLKDMIQGQELTQATTCAQDLQGSGI